MTGFRYIPGVKGDSVAFSRVVRLVCGEVTPPLAVIVPEVMVGVLPVNPDRQL